MLALASCDQHGSVFLDDQWVYRVIQDSERQPVLKTLERIGEFQSLGLIETSVAGPDEVPPELEKYKTSLVLRHRRAKRISYPHEWCASMLKDAALYHLQLSIDLCKKGLHLKDAHPWNILFENGRPVFVDITSIVTVKSLFTETYLDSNKKHIGGSDDVRLAYVTREIFERTYIPYFYIPLCGYAFGQRSLIPKKIENSTLNAAESTMTLRDCIATRPARLGTARKALSLLANYHNVRTLFSKLTSKRDLLEFFYSCKECVERLDVAIGNSAYSTYYQTKGEDQEFDHREGWNNKQRTVYKALTGHNIATVLDVACNTGWYSILANRLGKEVVAFDNDEASIEVLNERVKSESFDILPLVMNITNLTSDRRSLYDGKRVLINAADRFRCDSVLALGILHHLVLGLGLSFEDVLKQLNELAMKQLVLEFVDISDEKIRNEPTFFPAYHKEPSGFRHYTLDNLISFLKRSYSSVRIEPSHPETRVIVVGER